jgi:hypothetical protein
MDKPFVHGDLVFIDNLDETMSHFPTKQYGVVDYSYFDMYGGKSREEFIYSLVLSDGAHAWYPHECLKLKKEAIDRETYNQWYMRQIKKVKALNNG